MLRRLSLVALKSTLEVSVHILFVYKQMKSIDYIFTGTVIRVPWNNLREVTVDQIFPKDLRTKIILYCI